MKLINDFHNTSVNIRKDIRELQEIEATAFTSTFPEDKQKALRYIHRIRKQLCGHEGCTCVGTFGERPHYSSQMREEDGKEN